MKYKNKKTKIGNLVFDSKKEAERYAFLRVLEQKGVISDLVLQPKYTLVDKQYFDSVGKYERAISYKADFSYYNTRTRELVVEDVKGYKTKEYKLKRKLMKYFHGIEVVEV